jgi:hypothetical protein
VSFRRQALLLAAIAVALYANTVGNGYALDDGIVIQSNRFVERGLAGIPDILTRDAFHSHYAQMGVDEDQLSGGRYRPLSIVTFAIEQTLVGDNAGERHLVNVLLYALTAVLLLRLLRGHVFAGRPDLAFLTTLVFVVHPIHTEVVANVKGRDEILCFLFVIATLHLALSRAASGKRGLPVAALVVFLLALLSKEYALTLLVLLPVALYLVSRLDVQKSLLRTVPFALVATVYLALRFAAVGLRRVDSPEILSNPYLYATPVEAWATKIAVLLRYAWLLVLPHPLSSDYSYRQIPYVGFSNAMVWLSVALHVVLIGLALRWLRRRNVMAFAVLFYLANLLLVSNLLVGIGATMGERLAYHASLGFCMVLAWLLLDVWPTRAGATNRKVLAVLVGTLVVLAGVKTISRNFDWKDTPTLFVRDVRVVPDSATAHANASLHYLEPARTSEDPATRRELATRALAHLDRALEIHPEFTNAFLNRGLAWFLLEDYERAESDWRAVHDRFPEHPALAEKLSALSAACFNRGLDVGSEGRFDEALVWFERARRVDPLNALILTNLGKAHYGLGQTDLARRAWSRALELDPGQVAARAGLDVVGPAPAASR